MPCSVCTSWSTGTWVFQKEGLFQHPPLTTTREHPSRVAKPRADSRMKGNHFAVRVMTDWNSLPHDGVEAPSINSCKNRLEQALDEIHVSDY